MKAFSVYHTFTIAMCCRPSSAFHENIYIVSDLPKFNQKIRSISQQDSAKFEFKLHTKPKTRAPAKPALNFLFIFIIVILFYISGPSFFPTMPRDSGTTCYHIRRERGRDPIRPNLVTFPSIEHLLNKARPKDAETQVTFGQGIRSSTNHQAPLTPQEHAMNTIPELPRGLDPAFWTAASPSRESDKRFLSDVVLLYKARMFTPIARMIGVTPQAALRMALGMHLDTIHKTVETSTGIPFFGHTPASVTPGVEDVQTQAPREWKHKELACLTTLWSEAYPFANMTAALSKVQARHLYRRHQNELATTLRYLDEKPWLVKADFERLAFIYHQKRETIGKSVARSMKVEEDNWRCLETALFDLEANYNQNSWSPQHASEELEMKDLLALTYSCRHGVTATVKNDLWMRIQEMLFDKRGRNLYPIVKRYAVRPMPGEGHRYCNGTEQNFEFREDILSWIWESLDCDLSLHEWWLYDQGQNSRRKVISLKFPSKVIHVGLDAYSSVKESISKSWTIHYRCPFWITLGISQYMY